MREILFKAKRIDNGEWIIGILIIFESIAYIMEDENTYVRAYYDGGDCVDLDMRAYKVDPSTICQYTGLTDKNGQKIWENDIVRHEDLTNGRYIARKQPMKNSAIKWNRNDAKFERDGGRDLYKSESRLEVVGNIFDNPELLNE